MPEQSEVAARVRKVIAEHLGASPESVVDSATLLDLGADSLDQVELVMAAEEEFDVHIDDDDAERALTVGEAVAVVERAVAAKAGATA